MNPGQLLSLLGQQITGYRGVLALSTAKTKYENPHPLYHQLRQINPVLWIPPARLWFVTGYDAVNDLLHNPAFGWGPAPYREGDKRTPAELNLFEQLQGRWLLFQDPPRHTLMRKLVQQAFSQTVAATDLDQQISQIAQGLLNPAKAAGEMELMSHFAKPLPLTVLMNLMAIPAEDRAWLSLHLEAYVDTLEVHRVPTVVSRANQAALVLGDYFQQVMGERRGQGGDDFLSQLIQAEVEGQRLNDDEVIANAVMLLIGFDNVRNSLGLAVWHLWQHPEQRALLRDRADLLPQAIEELLRYDGSVVMVYRRALTNVVLAGQRIQAGQGCAVVLAAANRDPARFSHPDSLNLMRPERGLPFGTGMHRCLGVQLAQKLLTLGLKHLLFAMPPFTVKTTRPEWRKSVAFRRLAVLPVSFGGTDVA